MPGRCGVLQGEQTSHGRFDRHEQKAGFPLSEVRKQIREGVPFGAVAAESQTRKPEPLFSPAGTSPPYATPRPLSPGREPDLRELPTDPTCRPFFRRLASVVSSVSELWCPPRTPCLAAGRGWWPTARRGALAIYGPAHSIAAQGRNAVGKGDQGNHRKDQRQPPVALGGAGGDGQ